MRHSALAVLVEPHCMHRFGKVGLGRLDVAVLVPVFDAVKLPYEIIPKFAPISIGEVAGVFLRWRQFDTDYVIPQ